jgi:hypothetical protein
MKNHMRSRTLMFGIDAAPALLVLASCCLVTASAAPAQSPAPQNRAAAIKESLAKNQAALRQYSWVETTEISLKGEVKKTEQKQCYYGADGKVQKTALPGNAQPQQPKQQASGGKRGGRLKQNIVENKIEDTKEYMEQVAAVVQQYVPPDPQKIQAAEAGGNLSVQPSATATTLTAKNYAKPGDSLAIGFDSSTNAIRTYQVTTYVEKPKDDGVALNVTFASLPDGTNYPQQSVLNVAAKKIQVKVTNSGYKKAGS